jgi:hypothetical protein
MPQTLAARSADPLRNRIAVAIGLVILLIAFDLIELEGEDLRRTPIEQRKRKLAKLARRPHAGIVLNEVFEGDGDILFAHACKLGCEGIVSKRLGSPYRSGRSKHGVKVKNPEAPAVKAGGGGRLGFASLGEGIVRDGGRSVPPDVDGSFSWSNAAFIHAFANWISRSHSASFLVNFANFKHCSAYRKHSSGFVIM